MRPIPLLVAACWAPEVADLPPSEPEPPPAPAADEGPAHGPGGSSPPPPLPDPPSTEPLPTPADLLPVEPFTAWTTSAPLTLVGPGGARVAEIAREGVRVEVVQSLAARQRLTCTGCPGPDRNVEGWLPSGHLRASRAPGGSGHDPLTAALKLRARWASGDALPEGATNATMCMLVDHGYLREPDRATWETDGGRLVLAYDGASWQVAELVAPADRPWDCRADGSFGQQVDAPGPASH